MVSPVLITIFQMPPLNGSAVMEFNGNFYSPVIDLLFGGNGKKSSEQRELTEIELRVMKNLNQKILEIWQSPGWMYFNLRHQSVHGNQSPVQSDHIAK
jgi:flagellar motor switch protein FliM